MIKNIMIVAAFIFSEMAFSAERTRELLWNQHCQQVSQDPRLFLKKLAAFENRLSFTNQGGLFNKGVCWWHSRLTRLSQYMAIFNPNEKPLTHAEAYVQVRRLRSGKPTLFNGYKNLYEFSRAHSSAIQKNLEEWQISNGGFQLGFLDGLMGSVSLPAQEFKMLMDTTYQYWQRQRPIYQVLQLPGMTAHSWLIVAMEPVLQGSEEGYKFQVIDSNYSTPQNWNYRYGETSFLYSRSPFISYTTHRGILEEEILTKRLTEACVNAKHQGDVTAGFNSWPNLDDELNAKDNSVRK